MYSLLLNDTPFNKVLNLGTSHAHWKCKVLKNKLTQQKNLAKLF